MIKTWPKVLLGDVLGERKEIPREDDLLSGRVRIVAKIGFNEGKIELRDDGETKTKMILIRPGDLVVSGINAAKGAIAIYSADNTESVAATIHYGAYIPNKKLVAVRYLWWLLRSRTFRDLLLRYVPGGIKTELKAARLLPIPIPLPSLSEQKRIVAGIEELASKIAEARDLRYQAIEEAEALTHSIGNIIFKDMANQFGSTKLETMTSRITKGESPEWQGFTYQDTGPLFIRSENVLWGVLNINSAVRIPEDFHKKLSRSQLQSGDVLINLVGASIGRACVVPQRLGDANVNQAVAVITPESQWILSEFLVRFLLSSAAQETIHGGKVETARPNISLADMRDMEIPIVPLAEQRRIVKELEALQTQVDPLKRFQAETAAEIDALLPSILDKAFKGEL